MRSRLICNIEQGCFVTSIVMGLSKGLMSKYRASLPDYGLP